MTRKRDRRSSPPSFGPRASPPAARLKGEPDAKADRASKPSSPRDRPGERREARVSLIYGFHSVLAALKAPRRELIRLYATPAAAERLGAEIAERGLETRTMRQRKYPRARRAKRSIRDSCSRRGRSHQSISRICPQTVLCWFSIRSPTRTMSAQFCAPQPPLPSMRL